MEIVFAQSIDFEWEIGVGSVVAVYFGGIDTAGHGDVQAIVVSRQCDCRIPRQGRLLTAQTRKSDTIYDFYEELTSIYGDGYDQKFE